MNDLHDTLIARAERGTRAGGEVIADRAFSVVDEAHVGALAAHAHGPARSRRTPIVLAGATALVVVVTVATLLSRPDAGRQPSTTLPSAGIDALAKFHWSTIPGTEVVGRFHPTIVWAGDEAFVWGGNDLAHNEANRNDGAAYIPALRMWRGIPRAPIAARTDAAGVWTGHEVVVFGGGGDNKDSHGPFADGAAFDTATDTWRRLASSPICATSNTPSLVWTGHAVLVATPPPTSGAPPCATVSLYDPVADRWDAIARLPVVVGPNDSIATQRLDGRVILELASPDTHTRWFTYDVRTNRWSAYAPTAREQRLFEIAGDALTGDAHVVLGPQSAVAYDLSTNATRTLARPPNIQNVNPFPPIWTGHELLFLGESDVPGHRGFGRYAGLRFGP